MVKFTARGGGMLRGAGGREQGGAAEGVPSFIQFGLMNDFWREMVEMAAQHYQRRF